MEEALLQAREFDEARQASGFDQTALDATARLGFANGAFEDNEEDTRAIVEEFFSKPVAEIPNSILPSTKPETLQKTPLTTLLKARTKTLTNQLAD